MFSANAYPRGRAYASRGQAQDFFGEGEAPAEPLR